MRLLKGCRFFLFALFLFSACKGQLSPSLAFGKRGTSEEFYADGNKVAVSLSSWNTQTFFDAVLDGCEYSDFQKPEKWTREMYEKRLDRLCEVMMLLDTDIIVLEEIENKAVIQDIVNRLAGGSWDSKKNWSYTCFAKEVGSAIGCAVFSRYKISEMLVHSLDIRIHENQQPSERPLMQVTLDINDVKLVLFVNHWKSKSGGEEESEIWRDWQESLLAERISGLDNSCIVACGDFNRSAEDFVIHKDTAKKTNIILRRPDASVVEVYSPWLNLNGECDFEKGSYFYQDEWERIDNIFAVQNVKISRFSQLDIAPLADEEGRPVAYKMYSGAGYSDHLPVKCLITLF